MIACALGLLMAVGVQEDDPFLGLPILEGAFARHDAAAVQDDASMPPQLKPAAPRRWAQGFSGAGNRSREASGDGVILRYTLFATSDPDVTEFGELTTVEAWLVNELQRQVPALRSVEVVDRAVVRHREERVTADLVRTLEVVGPQEAVDRAESFLDDTKSTNTQDLVVIECIVALRDDLELAGETMITVLGEASLKQATQEILGSTDADDIILNGRVSCFGGMVASISEINQVAYLQDFEVEAVQGAVIADPVIGTLTPGAILEATPIVHPDRRHVYLALEFKAATLKMPIEQADLQLANGMAPVTVQIPQMHQITVFDSQRLGPGEMGFRITGPMLSSWTEDGTSITRTVDILVRAEAVTPEDPQPVLGSVEGYDASNHRVFVRAQTHAHAAAGDLLRIVRGEKVVGEARVQETRAGWWVLELVSGHVRAGDLLH